LYTDFERDNFAASAAVVKENVRAGGNVGRLEVQDVGMSARRDVRRRDDAVPPCPTFRPPDILTYKL
jgi:hypothetical protein